MILLLLACAGAPESAADGPDCSAEPVVTWENFGEGLLTENCDACHSATALDRHGAPESVVFDTHQEALQWRSQILMVTDPETRSMPPSLALSDDAQHLLWVWLTCWE